MGLWSCFGGSHQAKWMTMIPIDKSMGVTVTDQWGHMPYGERLPGAANVIDSRTVDCGSLRLGTFQDLLVGTF